MNCVHVLLIVCYKTCKVRQVAYKHRKAETNALVSSTQIRYTLTVRYKKITHAKQANGQQRAYIRTALQQPNHHYDCRKIGLTK
jgi:hypothetical protein